MLLHICICNRCDLWVAYCISRFALCRISHVACILRYSHVSQIASMLYILTTAYILLFLVLCHLSFSKGTILLSPCTEGIRCLLQEISETWLCTHPLHGLSTRSRNRPRTLSHTQSLLLSEVIVLFLGFSCSCPFIVSTSQQTRRFLTLTTSGIPTTLQITLRTLQKTLGRGCGTLQRTLQRMLDIRQAAGTHNHRSLPYRLHIRQDARTLDMRQDSGVYTGRKTLH